MWTKDFSSMSSSSSGHHRANRQLALGALALSGKLAQDVRDLEAAKNQLSAAIDAAQEANEKRIEQENHRNKRDFIPKRRRC